MAANETFEVGEHVVYPPHGAGTVVDKADRNGDEYLSIRIEHTNMTLMVPSSAAADRGVRKLVTKKQVKELMALLAGDATALNVNRQHRMRELGDRSKTGNATELASIIRDLHDHQAGGAKLSPVEQNMLASARQTLVSELALVHGITTDQANELIDKALTEGGREG